MFLSRTVKVELVCMKGVKVENKQLWIFLLFVFYNQSAEGKLREG